LNKTPVLSNDPAGDAVSDPRRPGAADPAANPRQGTGALEKGLTLLAHICSRETPPRYTDLLNETGIPKATLHRMLNALAAHRFIALSRRDHTYGVGVRGLELARKAWEGMDIRSAAVTELERLAAETRETVHLAVLDETSVVYIDKVESSLTIRMFSAIGKRGPAHCTGVGKAMLAFLGPDQRQRLLQELTMQQFTATTITDRAEFSRHLDEIRSLGYSKDLEEHELGIRCVAAPIFDYRGDVIASISVTAPSLRMTPGQLDEIAPLVVRAARVITGNLGGNMAR
jgi:DNA-binding IclR family transcriptional regulator